MTSKHRWPEGAIVYQVYPRSFYDSNADGIGDIPGITQKLDYIKSLGVNVIWLSPFYPSPMADFGYDVADYCDVDPIFGNLHDVKKLIKSAHSKDIRIMIDLVPNHSSDEHEWFRQSRQSREGPYADWYIWRDPKGFSDSNKPVPPNNWLDIFTGESAWEWEPARQQFYLHSFDVHQPDLNWANPEVRDAIKDAMRFWLDFGVDGFRVDAVRFMGKDPTFKDNPPNPHYNPHTDSKYGALLHKNSQGWPRLYAYLAEMAAVLKEKPYQKAPRFMVTESYPDTHEPIEEYLEFYESMDPEVAAPFNFEGIGMPWQAEPWRKFLKKFHASLDELNPLCVASYAFGNHDQSRLATRRGEPAARSAAVLLLTLPGMAFVYNGEEIGMQDAVIPQNMVQDPGAKDSSGRDPERTPLQWTPGKNAGFSTAAATWLPVSDNYKTCNVETESKDPASFLSLYRELGKLRNTLRSLGAGTFKIIDTGDSDVLGYERTYENETHSILINFSNQSRSFTAPYTQTEFVLSSDPQTKLKSDTTKLTLRPHEAVILSRAA
jgi:alpha-glucosidase